MIDVLLFVALLIALILVGVPIAWSLLITGTIGLIVKLGLTASVSIFTGTVYGETSVYLYSTIPMFILMAEFLAKSGITTRVFRAIHVWVGHIKGGLAVATTIANGGMAALSGSSTASAATMATIAVPEMRKYGYGDRLSMGTVAAAGTFAMMIPPSLGLIIYGIITETGIADLFLAGIIPGILTIGAYIGVIFAWARINPDIAGQASKKYSYRERFESLLPIYPAIILVGIVLGGLYSGAMTPTESGAIGASGALLVSVLFAGLRAKGINDAVGDALTTTTMIFMILISAMIFGRFLTVSGFTPFLVSTVGGLPVNRWIILVILLAVYVVLGMIMNQGAILILTLPITFPLVVDGLGFHPVWFGIVLVKVAEIGMVTPPLGLNVYIASSAIDVSPDVTFRGALRFVAADIVVLGIILAFPETVLWIL